MPIALARARRSVKVLLTIDSATGLSIDPPRACRQRKATSAVTLVARLHSSDPSGEQHQAGLEDAPPPEAVGHRPGRHQQAADHQRVGVDRPLQAAQRGVQPPPDGGQRHVDDGDVDAHDQQAHAADAEDQPRPPITCRHISIVCLQVIGMRVPVASGRLGPCRSGTRGQAVTASVRSRRAAGSAEQGEQAAAAVQRLGGRGEAGPGEQRGLDAVERRLADLERGTRACPPRRAGRRPASRRCRRRPAAAAR